MLTRPWLARLVDAHRMALDFGGGGAGSAWRVNVGAGNGLANLSPVTVWAWVYFGGAFNQDRLFQRNRVGGGFGLRWMWTGSVEVNINGSTAACTAIATLANFTAYASNKWLFVAGVVEFGQTDHILVIGDLTTPCAEPSTYGTRTTGTGALSDQSDLDTFWGNYQGLDLPFNGRVAAGGVLARKCTIGDLRRIQRGELLLAGTRGLWLFGHDGTRTQPDLSGRENRGTVTSAQAVSGLPLGRWRKRERVHYVAQEQHALGADVGIAVAATPNLTVPKPLAADTAIAVATAGDVTVPKPLVADAQLVVTATADATVPKPLAADAQLAVTSTANLVLVEVQHIPPKADVADGSWLNEGGSNVNLYASLDEPTANDSDWIESAAVPAADKAELDFGVVEQPDAGTLDLTVRAQSSA